MYTHTHMYINFGISCTLHVCMYIYICIYMYVFVYKCYTYSDYEATCRKGSTRVAFQTVRPLHRGKFQCTQPMFPNIRKYNSSKHCSLCKRARVPGMFVAQRHIQLCRVAVSRPCSNLCILYIQGSTKLSPVNHLVAGILVLVQKGSNTKKESYCCTEP